MREPLPVDDVLPDLLGALRKAGAVVLKAPTGSGKTTRVPPALLDAVEGLVIVLEPRRVAARAAARRIAAERGERVGETIGYQVRFERKASPATRLLVVTEGILLRRLQDDPLLEGVGAIVFDEFHERSLDSDLALALAQRVRSEVRDDLAVVVMSATLDPAPVAAFLGEAPVIETHGRSFPVDIEHRPGKPESRLERTVRSALLDVLPRSEGDVLVFLPGVGEIRRVARSLAEEGTGHDVDVLPLHGELPPREQDAALASGPRRRVILATNVAETSLTIPGVRVVIDAGLERLPRIDPGVGLERLETVRIARESADQRAGRAGRTAPGVCVRLWSRPEDARLAPRRAPEIERVDLAGALLQLLAFGETDLDDVPWFEAPPPPALAAASALLERLGASAEGRITEVGTTMARLPVQPRLARMLVTAGERGHGRRIALAAAALSDRSPFVPLPRGEVVDHVGPSDVLDAVEALEQFEERRTLRGGVRELRRGPARQALRVRDQLARMLPRTEAHGDADEAVLRALLAAYPDRVARRRAPGSDRAVMVGGRGLKLAPESSVREAELFVAVDVDAGRKGQHAEALVRRASIVERSWLPAQRTRTEETASFDEQTGSVRGARRALFGDLVLEEVAIQVDRGPLVEQALAEAAGADLDAALDLDDEAIASLRTRVACLRAWRPELVLPALDDQAVRGLIPDLVRGRRSFAELRKAPLLDHLRGLLTWEQMQVLDCEAPERVEVPSGSKVRLRYEEGKAPVLAVRIQEVFGLLETPTVAGGRVKVLMHLLAPNHRPQQITDDMPSFWANTYAGVRAELRRRYPKHAWPEDPYTAQAERRPQRRRRGGRSS
ncbi:MAG: ATP-dependent helicase HrpB [Planctomycetota bacterium]|nr:ATP-dependent helicase HrpB [Planctomycetota bacterium]